MYNLLKPLIFSLDPELAHNIGVIFIKRGIFNFFNTIPSEKLAVRVGNIDFPTPIGLAAGFDKNAEIFDEIFKIGFGFVEAGTVTPRPQYGNPKPRIFRLKQDSGLINRLGFNNVGLDEFVSNIVKIKPVNNCQKIGANLGPNKDSVNRVDDYVEGIRRVSKIVDYITINISSPNTENLRDFENSKIVELLKEIESNRLDDTPIFIKISPDIENKQISSLIESSIKHKMNGLIVSNTSKDRRFGLKSKNIPKDGGLSGAPILSLANEKLSFAYSIAKNSIPIIGVGGVSSGADAYKKIKLGASLVQLYTSLVYEGPSLISKINNDLVELMKLDGVSNLSEVVGITKLKP